MGAKERKETENSVPFDVLTAAEGNGMDEQTVGGDVNSDLGSLPSSKAANFCYVIGGLGILIGVFLMLADERDVPAPFLTGLTVVIAHGFVICVGAAIQYLFDIRNILNSDRGDKNA